jgi:Zn-finger protein
MSNLYRGPSIDASYQVSYHLAKRFQRKSCFRNRPIRNNNCLWRPCLLTDQNGMSNSHRCFLPRFGPFGQAVSEKKIFRNRPIRNKNCLWWPCLLMDQDEMSNLYRGHSIDASYQVSVYLAKWFQRRRFFRNQSIRNKNCLWRQCLLTDRDEMSNHNRGPSIDASYQVLVHLAKRFQGRRI